MASHKLASPHFAGRFSEAIAALREEDQRNPYDLEVLNAQVSMERESGGRQSVGGAGRCTKDSRGHAS